MLLPILRSLSLLLLASMISFQSSAQICGGVSGGPRYIRDFKIPPRSFLQMNKDFALIDEHKSLTTLYVSSKFLNARSSPKFGPVVGTLFRGQKIRVYGRKGNWVAFRPQKGRHLVYWAHIDYLSFSSRGKTTVQELHSKCSIDEMVEHLEDKSVNRSCYWVAEYLYANTNGSSNDYESKLLQHAESEGFQKAYSRIRSNCF